MTLSMMKLKPLVVDGWAHKPFSDSDDFSNEWWCEALYGDEPGQHFYAFFDGQHEVVRVEVEVQDKLNEDYERPAHPGPYAVINFFEVSTDHRRRGFGAEAVRLIAARYEGTPLVAFSAGADEFWGSLGWERYGHATELDHSRPMFVSDPHSPPTHVSL